MSHFAKIDNIVAQVIVAELDFINLGAVGDPASWFQTSYNTQGGKHINVGTPFRKNYAGIRYTYDASLDAFISPKPFPSWVLVADTCLWNAPIAMPSDGKAYAWDEATQAWQEATVHIQ